MIQLPTMVLDFSVLTLTVGSKGTLIQWRKRPGLKVYHCIAIKTWRWDR